MEFGRPTSLKRDEGLTGHGNWVLDERRLRLSISSSTMLTKRSVGSSTLDRFTVSERSCSAILSQPKNCRKSTSHISSALTFLKASNGTAVSKGNSSYPLMRRALRSGDSRRHGIFVKAEYKYFRSINSCTLAFSVLAALVEGPKPKLDHRLDMPDMTLRTLDME